MVQAGASDEFSAERDLGLRCVGRVIHAAHK